MKIVTPKNGEEYDKDRQISNARFDYRPRAIYYCESTENVSQAILDAHNDGVRVRIRSGGHQHEGMCTADGVYLIDLSCIHSLDYYPAGYVWIGAGAALRDVYVDQWLNGYLFSGGGCGDVHVGGLTQGGGWGPISRKYGLTCDSLVGVEMVDATGAIWKISDEGEQPERDLLWALRGGGGGNFGVVTKFCFRLHPWAPQVYTDVTLTWGDKELDGTLDDLVLNWVRLFPRDDDDKLTTYLRVSVVDGSDGDRVVIGGRYLGTVEEAQTVMNRLLAGQRPPRTADYQPSLARVTPATEPIAPEQLEHLRRTLGTLPGYQPGPALRAQAPAAAGAEPNLADTCAGTPLRHKISSGFARPEFDRPAIQTLTRFISRALPLQKARQYVSLHCLGGAIAKDAAGSAFAFRERNVLLQYQAWWEPDAVDLDIPCISWIESFRLAMAPHTDGAFINFVDRDIPIREYYKDSLPDLSKLRKTWDPSDFFHFQMSIPFGIARVGKGHI